MSSERCPRIKATSPPPESGIQILHKCNVGLFVHNYLQHYYALVARLDAGMNIVWMKILVWMKFLEMRGNARKTPERAPLTSQREACDCCPYLGH